MQPYQTRVICLRSSLDRRKHICSEFEKFNIDFSFLDALEAKETIFYDNFLSLKFNPKALTSGEVACFMSHVLIWHALASSDLEEMVIYEDDIWLGKGSKELFSSKSWLPLDYDFIKLETMLTKQRISRSLTTKILAGCSRSTQALLSDHMGLAGYVISQSFAKKCIDILNTNKFINDPIDVWIYAASSHRERIIYQLNPAICIQDKVLYPNSTNLGSELDIARSSLKPKSEKKTSPLLKLIRELLRVLRQLKLRFKPYSNERVRFY